MIGTFGSAPESADGRTSSCKTLASKRSIDRPIKLDDGVTEQLVDDSLRKELSTNWLFLFIIRATDLVG